MPLCKEEQPVLAAFAKRALFFLAVVVLVLHKLTQAVAREMVINNAFSLQTKATTGALLAKV